MTTLIVETIPDALRGLTQWVCWKYETRNDKRTKVPYMPDGRRASTTNPATWSIFADCVQASAQFDGIGIICANGLAGIDLDHCIDEAGNLSELAQYVIQTLNTYTEITPSGHGLHCLCFAQLPVGNRRNAEKQIEMYDSARYLTVTGNHLPNTPLSIEKREVELARLHAEILGGREPIAQPVPLLVERGAVSLDDQELLARAEQAKNGNEFRRLWRGDLSLHNGNHSNADLALCAHLAFWTGMDAARMDRLFRQSGLMRAKWDERHRADGATYGQMTIEKALSSVHNYFGSQLNSSGNGNGDGNRNAPALITSPKSDRSKNNSDLDGLIAALAEQPQELRDEEKLRQISNRRNEHGETFDAYSREPRAHDKSDPSPAEPPIRKSQATRLVEIGMEASFFHTPDEDAYARVQVRNHYETWALNSKGFRRWLGRRYFELEHKAPSKQSLLDALSVLEGHALYEGPEAMVHLRVADHDDKVYLDLANEEWQVVEVSANGWQILSESPVYFRRPHGMLALPQPIPGQVDQLRSFLNLAGEEDWRLLVSWLAAALREHGPFPTLVIHGGQGSTKSTTERIARALIDPNKASLRSGPREERDLMIAAINSWIIAFDNMSFLPAWLSDGICRLATGGGFSTRELFSDSDEVLFDAQRPVILNGIEELAVRGDLLDRAIVIYLPEMSPAKRKAEQSLWQRFKVAHPQILGGLLSAASTGLRNLPRVQVSPLPRMADFALWASATAPAFGWSPQDFISAYAHNQQGNNSLPLDASPIVEPLRQLIAEESWIGTATELLTILDGSLDPKVQKHASYPKSAQQLSNALRRLSANLKEAGIAVTFDQRESGTGRRFIHLDRTGNEVSLSSHLSQPLKIRAFLRDDGCNPSVTPSPQVSQPAGECDDATAVCDDGVTMGGVEKTSEKPSL